MSTGPVVTILVAGALALVAVPLTSFDAGAQSDMSKPVFIPIKPTVTSRPTAAAPLKRAPGKVCGELQPNSQAHKDCIARQAIDKAAKTLKAQKAQRKS
jgi:hypothetical protein